MSEPVFDPEGIAACVADPGRPLVVVRDRDGRLGVVSGGAGARGPGEVVAVLPPAGAGTLGDPGFRSRHGLGYAYLGGGMARGIGSERLVAELARAGMLGFFGAAGLAPARVEAAIETLGRELAASDAPWGVNLIHTPDDSAREETLVDLFLARQVSRVEAAAYLELTPAVVRYSLRGLEADGAGGVRRRTSVFAKVSRPEVARHFLSPAPAGMVRALLAGGRISEAEAGLAARVPVAEAVTVEADSGGHTDNRPLGPAFAAIAALARRVAGEHGYPVPALGAAGGLGTPECLAGAFAMGAAYVLVGSVHQACVESGTSPAVKAMLAAAGPADVAMTASADMFERGIRVQVLKKGTMMAARGNHLYALYSRYGGLEEIPEADRTNLERNLFGKPLEAVWDETRGYFEELDPGRIRAAERDPKARMGLVFRWYLGNSSRWAMAGDPDRRLDYQVWCGPAMGAFNEWARGGELERPEARKVGVVARSLMDAAAALTRRVLLRGLGVAVPEPGPGRA